VTGNLVGGRGPIRACSAGLGLAGDSPPGDPASVVFSVIALEALEGGDIAPEGVVEVAAWRSFSPSWPTVSWHIRSPRGTAVRSAAVAEEAQPVGDDREPTPRRL
jgi:hypothetical protein